MPVITPALLRRWPLPQPAHGGDKEERGRVLVVGGDAAMPGIIAGLTARGAEPFQAAAWGVYLHAAAGDRLAKKSGLLGYLAREIPAEIPPLMHLLSTPHRR